MSEQATVDDAQRAVDALVHRLRMWGVSDPEPKAMEFITALRGQGWRPTEARAAADWRPPRTQGAPATDEWKRVKAVVAARCPSAPRPRATQLAREEITAS